MTQASSSPPRRERPAFGGVGGYAAAATLVKRLARPTSAADPAAFLARLKDRHGRKRTFMALP